MKLFFKSFKVIMLFCELLINTIKMGAEVLFYMLINANQRCKRILDYKKCSESEKEFTSKPHLKNPNSIQKIVELKCGRKTLENWFELHKNYPYATKSELINLSLITNYDIKKVKRWLENKRRKSKEVFLLRPGKLFNDEDKQIMQNFFKNKSDHPGPDDLDFLENIIQKDKKQIRNWFNHERFKSKKYFMQNESP